MEFVHKAEKSLEGVFGGLPPLSSSIKETLAQIWPWLALIGGILEILAALSLWHLTRAVDAVGDIYRAYGLNDAYYTGLSSTDKLIIYLGIIIVLVVGIMMLVAFPRLRKRQKSGWDIMFAVALLNLLYGVVSIFIDGRGLFSLIGNLIGTAIGLYLLYQVREKFGGSAVARPAAVPLATGQDDTKKPDETKPSGEK